MTAHDFGVLRMHRDCHGLEELLVARHTADVFGRASPLPGNAHRVLQGNDHIDAALDFDFVLPVVAIVVDLRAA